jgi:hypothetical protein
LPLLDHAIGAHQRWKAALQAALDQGAALHRAELA